MIESADDRLSAWASGICPGAEVALAWSDAPADKRPRVVCHLIELAAAPPSRPISSGRGAALQYAARYLITTVSADRRDEHRLLGLLIASALDHPDFDVDLAGLSSATWIALHQVPRPGFIIQVLLRRERAEPTGHLVRELVVQDAVLTGLAGQVVGPAARPLAGARLEIPAMNRSTYTDQRGRFTFPGIPADPLPSLMRVLARGRQLEIDPSRLIAKDRTLTITFPITET